MYIFLAIAVWLTRWLDRSADCPHARRKVCRPRTVPNAPKPAWVREEILRLKILMPDAGCRSIEMIFNRRFALARGVTVGKTYVARVFSAQRYDVQVRRNRTRGAAPRYWPLNARWGLDLTAFRGDGGRRYWILGIVEYCSRALLLLVVLVRKTAAALARALATAFEQFGPPQSLVTDNEGPFRSCIWKRLLARFGVRLRRIAPYCPWQNGRIERFFGTLKPKLRQRGARTPNGLQRDLDVFRHWYNRIRPHQALGIALWNGAVRLNLTPAEAWHREAGDDRGVWFEAWNGILRGYSCRI